MGELSKKEKITIMLAIMGTMLFASLNQTSIGTALPRIVASLGGMEYYSWSFTIYILMSAVVLIVAGKLSDIYGRKIFLILGLVTFMIGSLLCGLAHNMFFLIAYRAIQGLGAGMIFANAVAAIGDLFTPKERGRWQGLMASVFGLSSLAGPLIGGTIVDHWHWPWVFWINLPIGVLALILIIKLFPEKALPKTKRHIDILGATYLVISTSSLLLACSFGGIELPWLSWQIIALFTVCIVTFILFIRTETRVEEPILPLKLFKNSIYSLASVVGFVTGFVMFGTAMFVPLYVQGAMGLSATQSGLLMMPMMLSWVTTSAISGQITSRTGKYKLLSIVGALSIVIGLFLLTQMTLDASTLVVIRNMILIGIGLGVLMPTFMLIVQNALPHKVLGVVSSTTQLYRQLGGTIGVTIMGTIMTYQLRKNLVDGVSVEEQALLEQTGLTAITDPNTLLDPDFMTDIKAKLTADLLPLFNEMQQHLQASLGISIVSVFWISATLALLALILTLFIKEIPLRDKHEDPEDSVDSEIDDLEQNLTATSDKREKKSIKQAPSLEQKHSV